MGHLFTPLLTKIRILVHQVKYMREAKRDQLARAAGVLGFLLSIYSILLTREEHNMRVREYKLTQVPIWDLSYDHDDDDKEQLIPVTIGFNSRSPNIQLRSYSVYCPSAYSDSAVDGSYGNTWSCYDFLQRLDDQFQEVVNLPVAGNVLEVALHPLDLEVSVPIAVKYNYFFGLTANESYDIYLVHFIYYSSKKFRVKKLELVDRMSGTRLNKVINTLNQLDRTKGLVYAHERFGGNYTRQYAALYKLINSLSATNQYGGWSAATFDSKNGGSFNAFVPSIYDDSLHTRVFDRRWQSLLQQQSCFTPFIREDLQQLNSFLQRFPVAGNQYRDDSNNLWRNDSTYQQWDLLIARLIEHYNQAIKR